MKNNYKKQIENIKKLMFINEQTSNDECEAQLEKDGYIVYDPKEKDIDSEDCMSNNLIKCSYNILKNLDNIIIDIPPKYGGKCYIEIKTKDYYEYNVDNKNYKYHKFYIYLWGGKGESGEITFIINIKPDTFKEIYKFNDNYAVFQILYHGKYECSDNDIKLFNLQYQSHYDNFNTKEISKQKIYKTENEETPLNPKNAFNRQVSKYKYLIKDLIEKNF